MLCKEFMRFLFSFTHLSTWLHAASEWILPSICLICGHRSKCSASICKPCQNELPILPQCCVQCAKFLCISSQPLPKEEEHRLLCGACLQKPPPFERTFALFPYEPPLISLIAALKFKGKLEVAALFSRLFLQKLPIWYEQKPLPDLLIPIPLHTKRLRERGFNQALEIAKPIAASLSISLDKTSTIRIKHTQPQSHLAKMTRKQNIKNAFMLKKKVAGLHIAVIDDVITTGETMKTFCQLLKENGAKSIHLWCCTRRG